MNQERPQGRSSRLVGTLAFFGALAGLMIVVAFQWAQPRILAERAATLQAAVVEVLGAPERVQSLFVVGNELTATPPANADTTTLERVFIGYDAAGNTIGYAIIGAQPGFADVITLIFGYDHANKRLLGMKVLDNKETPGLGDKIVKDTSFVNEFVGVTAPLRGVKAGAGKGEPNEIDMITGATISARTIVNIINRQLVRVEPLLVRYAEEQP